MPVNLKERGANKFAPLLDFFENCYNSLGGKNMFAVIIADVALVIAGSVFLKMPKITKNGKRKMLIIFLVIGFGCLILWLNYRFIDSTYNWILSIIFITSMFIEYFKPDTPDNKNTFNDKYRGD